MLIISTLLMTAFYLAFGGVCLYASARILWVEWSQRYGDSIRSMKIAVGIVLLFFGVLFLGAGCERSREAWLLSKTHDIIELVRISDVQHIVLPPQSSSGFFPIEVEVWWTAFSSDKYEQQVFFVLGRHDWEVGDHVRVEFKVRDRRNLSYRVLIDDDVE